MTYEKRVYDIPGSTCALQVSGTFAAADAPASGMPAADAPASGMPATDAPASGIPAAGAGTSCRIPSPRGWLLYVHGGGFLFGDRDDLPEEIRDGFLREGFSILSFDYSLAPHAKLQEILQDIRNSVAWFLAEMGRGAFPAAPWFLWGRSAGGFLCLMTGLHSFPVKPAGILSWYGYGFLEDGWYDSPSPFYSRLVAQAGIPPAPAPEDVLFTEKPRASAAPRKGFPLYARARAEGTWISWFCKGRKKDFLRDCSLRGKALPEDFPPTLLIHGTEDPDVPFAESQKLQDLLPKARLVPLITTKHDFDADPASSAAKSCMKESIAFLLENRGLEPLTFALPESTISGTSPKFKISTNL